MYDNIICHLQFKTNKLVQLTNNVVIMSSSMCNYTLYDGLIPNIATMRYVHEVLNECS